MFPEGRLLLLRPPRLQRGRLLLRRLGPVTRLHHHRRDQRLLRAPLPGGVLARTRSWAVGRGRRRLGGGDPGVAQHPRSGGIDRAQTSTGWQADPLTDLLGAIATESLRHHCDPPQGGPDRGYRLDDRRVGRVLPLSPPPGTRSEEGVPDPVAQRPVGFVEVAYHSAPVPILGASVHIEAGASAELDGPDDVRGGRFTISRCPAAPATPGSRRRSARPPGCWRSHACRPRWPAAGCAAG